MAEKLKTLRLILGDQLNHQHSWFKEEQEHITYVMMEMRQETDYVVHHIQKVIGFFSAMRNFADHLTERDHEVIYLKIGDKSNRQQLKENLEKLLIKINEIRKESNFKKSFLLKISPDLELLTDEDCSNHCGQPPHFLDT